MKIFLPQFINVRNKLVLVRLYQPSQMYEGKAGAFTSTSLMLHSGVGSWHCPQTLD